MLGCAPSSPRPNEAPGSGRWQHRLSLAPGGAMKLARSGDSWFVVVEAGAVDVTDLIESVGPSWPSLCERFKSVQDDLARACVSRSPVEVDRCRLDAPIVAPSKIVGVLGNDIDRLRPGGDGGDGEIDATLDFFLKAPSSLIGPSGSVRLPLLDSPLDVSTRLARVVPECELAVVVGRGGDNLAVSEIPDHIFGYTIGLDLTARGPTERSRRKSFTTFCPVGPWIVTPDETGDDWDLDVTLRIGDDLHQKWSTRQMAYPVAEVVSWVSRCVRLEPGDLILTGAPKMTRVLEPGDRLCGEIGRIGKLEIDVDGPVPLRGER
jgi:2-keto-4-pentenoate hydratase/2-oxohepta-3-ene-1,7-dioic acid hydratase in catechol pathway